MQYIKKMYYDILNYNSFCCLWICTMCVFDLSKKKKNKKKKNKQKKQTNKQTNKQKIVMHIFVWRNRTSTSVEYLAWDAYFIPRINLESRMRCCPIFRFRIKLVFCGSFCALLHFFGFIFVFGLWLHVDVPTITYLVNDVVLIRIY